jgi:FixJ family two-component response regulator
VPLATTSTADTRTPVVHIVEDDASARDATARFLRAAGYAVRTYSTATEMLEGLPSRSSGCVVLDLRLPGLNGLEAQRAMEQLEEPLPVVFLSGLSDIAESVQAMKAGAVDFLTKTADGSLLLEAVSRALAKDTEARSRRQRLRELRARHGRLSAREQQVLGHLISGQLNKQVGFDLGITEQTTKIHRHRVLEKMEADSIADLVRMAADLGIEPVGRVR